MSLDLFLLTQDKSSESFFLHIIEQFINDNVQLKVEWLLVICSTLTVEVACFEAQKYISRSFLQKGITTCQPKLTEICFILIYMDFSMGHTWWYHPSF